VKVCQKSPLAQLIGYEVDLHPGKCRLEWEVANPIADDGTTAAASPSVVNCTATIDPNPMAVAITSRIIRLLLGTHSATEVFDTRSHLSISL
jgi:hypothetical protein